MSIKSRRLKRLRRDRRRNSETYLIKLATHSWTTWPQIWPVLICTFLSCDRQKGSRVESRGGGLRLLWQSPPSSPSELTIVYYFFNISTGRPFAFIPCAPIWVIFPGRGFFWHIFCFLSWFVRLMTLFAPDGVGFHRGCEADIK